mmetsp:Transcript_1619/g.4104  ORF Transcript_1619/g.4104 Transcript_1619/m.4104 type:complete len:659 (-) Transcript_1619:106-2082(-)
MPADNCVSVRARVRKSRRAIDPEFDACQEVLVSFVDVTAQQHEQQQQQPPPFRTKDNGDTKPKKRNGGPTLLLTPAPSVVPAGGPRPLQQRGNAAPVKRRMRSYGGGGGPGSEAGTMMQFGGGPPPGHGRRHSSLSSTPCSSDAGANHHRDYRRGFSVPSAATDCADGGGGVECGMVDVSLDDSEGGSEARCPTNAANPGAALASPHAHPLGLPPQPMIPGHHVGRYHSPLAVGRTSSNASGSGGGSVASRARSDSLGLEGSARSRAGSARSRSRSRSSRRMGGGHLRMRSLGASSAFAAAAASSPGNGDEEMTEGSVHGSTPPPARPDPISIPLGDILSVDEEIPSGKGERGGGAGGGGGSDFFSSAVSDVGAAKEGGNGGCKMRSPSPLRSPTAPPSTTNGGRVPYRIFLHTLSHGYVEFSLDNMNSHDIFMAYLKAHLEPDRIPNRDAPTGGAKRGPELLRTMVLTPTKEVPSNLSDSTRTHGSKPAEIGSVAEIPTAPSRPPPPRPPSNLPRPGLVTRSNSTMSCNIDRLHSKVIKQRLEDESTPLQRMKDSIAGWMSTVMDCACCQDTTVAPLDPAGSIQGTPDKGRLLRGANRNGKAGGGLQRSPNTEKLRCKGITGLSFEEISSCGGTPKMSFEKSFERSVGAAETPGGRR